MAQGMIPVVKRVAPGTTVSEIVSYNERRRSINVENLHATQSCVVGTNPGLTAAAGHLLAPNRGAGSKLSIKGMAARHPLYAITGAGTSDLSVIESSDADIS